LHTHTLSNGLRVTIVEDHTTPVVAVNLWYHVGSANERAGRTGFAHLFEHMLFQGSEHVEANEHFELVQRAGGTLNGSTWLERTNYYETVPSHHLALALWLEADRMGRLLPGLTQEKLDTQRDVVKNERRWSVDNQPYGTWWEKLPALAFPAGHPFHHSLIGSFEDLDAASLDDVREFFTTWYAPDNAVLSIVGDVEVASALGLVEEYFGMIPRGGPRPPLADFTVPERFGTWRREVVEDDVMVPRLFLAFRAPPFGAPDAPVATIAAALLGNGRASRLQDALVRGQEVATSATAFTFDLSRGRDLLVLDVTARPEVGGSTIEQHVTDVLEALRRTGATSAEVERAVALSGTEYVTTMQSAQSRADRMSQAMTYCGDAAAVWRWPERLAAVTTDQVNTFVRDWMGEDNRVSLLYVPRVEEGA
jgi:predicted Zn-dependent peptidase